MYYIRTFCHIVYHEWMKNTLPLRVPFKKNYFSVAVNISIVLQTMKTLTTVWQSFHNAEHLMALYFRATSNYFSILHQVGYQTNEIKAVHQLIWFFFDQRILFLIVCFWSRNPHTKHTLIVRSHSIYILVTKLTVIKLG